MIYEPIPDFVRTLFKQLRRRGFALGLDDLAALRLALRAGFGWSSRQALRDLCAALWAKSRREKEILEALFDELNVTRWTLPRPGELARAVPGSKDRQVETPPRELEGQPVDTLELELESQPADSPEAIVGSEPDTQGPMPSLPKPPERPLATEAYGGLPPVSLDRFRLPAHPFVYVPQFHLTYRQVAQAWRRLRQPVREGPPTELDVEATVARRCRLGVASDVVLVPRRRNTARLLLLVDRQGSMTPFHKLVDEVCAAIQQAGNLEYVALYYFHDVPAEGADESILEALPERLFPSLDPVLPDIAPLTAGYVYSDPDMLLSQPLSDVLEAYAAGAAVVVASDAGAARGRYDILRLLDTVAFLKALRVYTQQVVWLNPLPTVYEGRKYWANSTAAQIARHVPMFPLDHAGMYQAVNVLRGQPAAIERPL